MTLMTRIMVGLIGITTDLISSSTIPTTDSMTMATSSWFHLENQQRYCVPVREVIIIIIIIVIIIIHEFHGDTSLEHNFRAADNRLIFRHGIRQKRFCREIHCIQ